MRSSQQGFTLAETLVVVVVAVLIGTAVVSMWIGYNNYFSLELAQASVGSDAERIMSQAEVAALQASGVASSHTFSGTTITSTSSALVLQVPSIDSSGTILANTYDYIALYASSTNAYKAIDAAAGSSRTTGTTKLSASLQSLSFTYYTSPVTSATSTFIDVRTAATLLRGTAASHLSETLYFRNK